jgi:hypothetical protein
LNCVAYFFSPDIECFSFHSDSGCLLQKLAKTNICIVSLSLFDAEDIAQSPFEYPSVKLLAGRGLMLCMAKMSP